MSSYDPEEAARVLLNAVTSVLAQQGKTMPTADAMVRRTVAGRLRAAYQAGQREAVRPPTQAVARGHRKRPTGRQQEALDFITDFVTDNGFPPTLREIGDYMGIRSTNGVNDHLKALERKGYLERTELQSRAIRVIGLETHQELSKRCAQIETALGHLAGVIDERDQLLSWAEEMGCEMQADDLEGYTPEECSPHHSGRCWPCEAKVRAKALDPVDGVAG